MPSHDELLCEICGEPGYVVGFDDEGWTDLRCDNRHVWVVRHDA